MIIFAILVTTEYDEYDSDPPTIKLFKDRLAAIDYGSKVDNDMYSRATLIETELKDD